jgi:hypothetical protein
VSSGGYDGISDLYELRRMKMRYLLLILPLLLLAALPVLGSSAYLGGYSGLILTPDATVAPQGAWDLSFHDLIGVTDSGSDFLTYSLTYGLLDNLEIGGAIVNSAGSTDLAINGKYVILTEEARRPALAIGVYDVFGMVNTVNENPSFYILVSKDLTAAASKAVKVCSKPFRVNLGLGSGVFNPVFAGFDWTLVRNLSVQAEYTNGTLDDQSSLFNAGIRWAVAKQFRIDAALIQFQDFAFGINYRMGGF